MTSSNNTGTTTLNIKSTAAETETVNTTERVGTTNWPTTKTESSAVTNQMSSATIGTTESTTIEPITKASPITTTTPLTHPPRAYQSLDRDAIIAGAVVGILLVIILVIGVCLARAKRRRAGRDCEAARAKTTPRPSPAGACALVREPNPYMNPCFNTTKEEMGERAQKTAQEPCKSVAESINSVRNKEENWIIPLEELADDDALATYDTTKF